MKIKITRPDGSVIEAEGTAEECAALIAAPAYVAPVVPTYIPYAVPCVPQPWDFGGPTWYAAPTHTTIGHGLTLAAASSGRFS